MMRRKCSDKGRKFSVAVMTVLAIPLGMPCLILYAMRFGKNRILKLCIAVVLTMVIDTTSFYMLSVPHDVADITPSVANDDYAVSLAVRRKGDDVWRYGCVQVYPGDTIEVMALYENIGEQPQCAYAGYDYYTDGGLQYAPDLEIFKNAEYPAGVSLHQDWTAHQLTAGTYKPGENFSYCGAFEVPDDYFDTTEYLYRTNPLVAWVCVVRMVDGKADTANSLWLKATTVVQVVPKIGTYWLNIVKNGYWTIVGCILAEAFLIWLIILVITTGYSLCRSIWRGDFAKI